MKSLITVSYTHLTLVPHKELTLEEVWNIVTGSPRLKKLTEAAAAAYGDEKEYRRLQVAWPMLWTYSLRLI